MKRTAKSGLVPAPANLVGGNLHSRVFNRVAPQKTDWFRIDNSHTATDGDVTKVYIYDEIGYWGTTASDFVKQLLDIDTSEIHLHLNSPGGSVFDGIAIYNGLKMHKAKVTTFVDALAASAASFIAQAGDEVIMARNAEMMIHDASGLAYGNAADMRDLADILDRLSNNIADIYAFNAGGTVEEFRALMQAETWFSAQEAVDEGLATSMLDVEDASAEEAKNRWDLSIFNHARRKDAPSPSEIRREVLTITNVGKEAPMAKAPVKNTTDPAEGTPPASDPPAAPAAPEAPADPQPVEAPEEDPEGGTPDQGGDPQSTPSAEPSNKAGGVRFKINNSLSTDAVAVQNHIDGLELFRKETLENARKQFVQNLAAGNKIPATQIDDLEEFALSLSNDQYEKWTATWNAAGSIPLLGTHGGTQLPAGGDPTPVEAKAADEIAKFEAIVKQHKLSGLKPEAIMKTESYKNLIALKPDFKL